MTDQPSGFVVAVVDDDQGILRSLEYLLDSADYAVRLFTSGAELLDSGCMPEIDCLISDIDMPGMDGFELLRLVHAARPGLPIILITGYPDTLKQLPPLGKATPDSSSSPSKGRSCSRPSARVCVPAGEECTSWLGVICETDRPSSPAVWGRPVS